MLMSYTATVLEIYFVCLPEDDLLFNFGDFALQRFFRPEGRKDPLIP